MALRSICAEFGEGAHVTANDCPSVGTVREVVLQGTDFFYRVDWPDFPKDTRLYREDELDWAPQGSYR
jgi:hypothetical protein